MPSAVSQKESGVWWPALLAKMSKKMYTKSWGNCATRNGSCSSCWIASVKSKTAKLLVFNQGLLAFPLPYRFGWWANPCAAPWWIVSSKMPHWIVVQTNGKLVFVFAHISQRFFNENVTGSFCSSRLCPLTYGRQRLEGIRRISSAVFISFCFAVDKVIGRHGGKPDTNPRDSEPENHPKFNSFADDLDTWSLSRWHLLHRPRANWSTPTRWFNVWRKKWKGRCRIFTCQSFDMKW